MDYFLFKQINDLAGRWPWLDALGIFCSEYLIFILFALPFAYFLFRRKKAVFGLLVKVSAAFFLAWTVNQFIGLLVFRARPFVTHAANLLIHKSALSKSFPSDHAAMAFAIAFSVYFFNKRIGAVFLFLASLVALGRLYVGVHYPTDVLSGAIVAWLAVWAVEIIANHAKFKLKRKKLVIYFKDRIKFFR